MSHFHAVVWIDHQKAQILQFNADSVETQTVRAHKHQTRQHQSGVRTEHEFFGEVCDDLANINEVVITGLRTATADFRHYLTKHRPAVLTHIVGWEIVDHSTDNQLVAFAKKYFVKYDRMHGAQAIPNTPDSTSDANDANDANADNFLNPAKADAKKRS